MAEMGQEKCNKIFSLLKSHNFHYLDTWAKECVDYFVLNNPNITDNELWQQVKEQWLLSDLRESAVAIFPPNLKSQPKVTLPGKYVVQVETIVDSGRSRYTQLQDLRKETSENIQATKKPGWDEPPEKRCLTLNVTDGVQDICAMEYEVIPELKLNHPDQLPGFKMLITGPVVCRHGMIMLSSRNVTVLGGEVNTLVNSNCYEALLMGTLGLTGPLKAVDAQKQLEQTLMDDNDDFLMGIPLDNANTENSIQTNIGQAGNSIVPSAENEQIDDLFNDDFDLADVPDVNDSTVGSERNNLKRQSSASSPTDARYELSRSNNFKRPCTTTLDEETVTSINNWSRPSTSNVSYVAPIQSSNRKFQSDEIVTKNRNMPSTSVKENPQTNLRKYLVAPPQAMDFDRGPRKVNAEPYVYLHQICKKQLTHDTMYKVKAIILTLKSKISVQGDNFSLLAKISDGSYCIDVNISSDILETMLGFSPSEMIVMLKEKRRNSALAEKLAMGFKTTQQKLISLNCIFCVQFYKDSSTPRVIGLEEITMQHVRALQQRQI